MPGFPGVFIGQSRHVAWTFTNVMADVQDLFVERIREGAERRRSRSTSSRASGGR